MPTVANRRALRLHSITGSYKPDQSLAWPSSHDVLCSFTEGIHNTAQSAAGQIAVLTESENVEDTQ